jgi:light-regulated signal transduction histidine kinase (bacteriophytochrome)
VFGVRRDRLVAKNIRTLVPDWNAHPAGGSVETVAAREDGAQFPVEISFSPLETEDGVVITSAIRDISERRKNEEQIRQLNTNLEERVLERTEELLRSNEELQQFAYVASHDLQEPLRTVSIYAQLLSKRYRGQFQGDADQFIDFIVQNAGRMEKLIFDLLDFSRVDARGSDFFAYTSCEAALDDAIRNLRSLVEETRAVITRDPLPAVMGDPVQLTRLFQNLVVNSIKYRGDSAPRIHVSARANHGEWTFSVIDNGIGIEPQYAEKIFGIFKVLQPRDKTSGSGMGLAICRKIVTRHEGRIWVESELGKGATFYFTLPRK